MTNWSVFKFGGNSLKDIDSLKKAIELVSDFGKDPLLIVVSAMAKTTNSLEAYLEAKINGDEILAKSILDEVINFHFQLSESMGLLDQTLKLGLEGEWNRIQGVPSDFAYDKRYDAIVSAGEIVSSMILHAAIQTKHPQSSWLDSRRVISTNNNHRRAEIDLLTTEHNIQNDLKNEQGIWITQGFIGFSMENQDYTTLGREGSDYSAAIFAYALNAEELTIWKDVPGLMSGDPKVFENVRLLEEVPYEEAIELAFFGASVIHPKTVQPLKSRNIILHVRSFLNNESKATKIGNFKKLKPVVPCLIKKSNQVMLSIRTKDLSFLSEGQLSEIYNIFSDIGLIVNLAQHGAASATFSVSNDHIILPLVLLKLQEYKVEIENNLVLYTVRYSDEVSRNWLYMKGKPKMEQRSLNIDRVLLSE